ncbi:conserved hypothetical protein [Candidatus Caldarchaeum subterraneum]|uniref:Toprim domain-containing protein n=1 Tax=Caldiarchaeum subterraneum TaxID=311458 RepID=E6N3J2_CALS0|nr:hypothetical protein HGMM_F30F06C24 [Candidatus Caldarchaeum subterraneum]BAJ50451.1 conserved hypothetical protein [Candidatus Caldarchaeum subterraneum]
MVDEMHYEEFRKTLENLVAEAVEDVVVLVEGARDEKALRLAGVRAKIVYVSRFREAVEMMPRPRKIILLLDFDSEGMKTVKRVSRLLRQMGYEVDESYHRRLRVLKRFGITTVEALAKLLEV